MPTPNSYQPQQILTNEAMRILKNKLVFLKGVSRDNEHLFNSGKKPGQQVLIRLPMRAVGRTGEAYNAEAYQETSVPCVVRPLQGMDIDMPSTDWVLNMNDIKREILTPAMAQLVNNVERDCLQIAYQGTANWVGTPGTAPSTSNVVLQAGAFLDNEGAPDDDTRRMLITPNTNVTLVPAFQGLLNPQPKIGKQFERGLIGKDTLGFDFFRTQNLWRHTVGTCTGTPLVNGANQSGTSIVSDGWTASVKILNKGDKVSFTIKSGGTVTVQAVNPMTRDVFGGRRQFTATADVYSDSSGNATIPISPVLIPAPAQFATVDNMPDDNAAIEVWSTAQAGLAALSGTSFTNCLGYHKDAFTFAGIKQKLPKGSTEQAWEATDPDTGIQLRFVQQYFGKDNVFINRFDVCYAFAVTYSQLACLMATS